MRKTYFILILLMGFLSLSAQTDSTQVTVSTHVTKAEADSAYINNDFTNAAELYESILKNKGESADIYYNLGNSYYKMNNIAKAVLNYERALLLNPGNNDIRFNLELARSKTVDKVTLPSEMFFITWIQSLINSMSEKDVLNRYCYLYFDYFYVSLIYFWQAGSMEKNRFHFCHMFLQSVYSLTFLLLNKRQNC